MPNNTVIYIFNRIVRLSILFFILYLVFTNFGTFLMIIGVILFLIFLFVYNLKKKIRKNGFNFQFNGQNFSNEGASNFNFNDFKNFNQEDFQNYTSQTSYSEINEAKKFFGFTQEPTKEEIKKRYKELARKYHPDINKGDDTKMKELNHFRDILVKTYK